MLIGSRKIEPEEGQFINKYGIKTLSIEEIKYDSAKTIRKLRNFIDSKEIYISFDIDVFDPNIVKATYYREENGLNEDEVLRFLDIILKKKENLRGFDLVEVNLDFPKQDVEETIKTARKVLGKFIS